MQPTDFEDFFSNENQNLLATFSKLNFDKAVLKIASSKNVFKQQLVQQLSAYRKVESKLPTWISTNNILFPPSINLEQCSSEFTAKYKSELVSGELLIDLTGGFGIDAYFYSKCFKSVVYIERDKALTELVSWNFQQLNAQNIFVINQDANHFLKSFKSDISSKQICFYIDPARRNSKNDKMVRFTDCEPNIVDLLPTLFQFADTVLLKSSPMHDIDLALKELKNVAEVHVVSVKNECKELLFLLKNNHSQSTHFKTINIYPSQIQKFDFIKEAEQNAIIDFSETLNYLYEPNASILKAGSFKLICEKFNIFKISSNSHFYTSNELISDFPGRIFEIKSKFDASEKLKYFSDNKANIICRNFPLSPEEVKKKYKINDGGNQFLICFKDKNDKPALFVGQTI